MSDQPSYTDRHPTADGKQLLSGLLKLHSCKILVSMRRGVKQSMDEALPIQRAWKVVLKGAAWKVPHPTFGSIAPYGSINVQIVTCALRNMGRCASPPDIAGMALPLAVHCAYISCAGSQYDELCNHCRLCTQMLC